MIPPVGRLSGKGKTLISLAGTLRAMFMQMSRRCNVRRAKSLVSISGRVGVNLDAGAGNLFLDGVDDADGEVVGLLERLVGFDFEVEVDELE